MYSSLQDTPVGKIVKYEFTPIGYYRAWADIAETPIFWFAVVNVIILNIYYRGFVYVIAGPRKNA